MKIISLKGLFKRKESDSVLMFILKRFTLFFTIIVFVFNFRVFRADIINLHRDWSGQTKQYEKAVERFKSELEKEKDTIVMKDLPSKNFAKRLANEFIVGDPDYFYAEKIAYGVQGKNDYVFYVTYIAKGEELVNAKKDFNERIQKIADTIDKSLSDFEKVSLVRKYLVENLKYDRSSNPIHNPYIMLVKGIGVCSGFCQLFKAICSKIGVDSEIVWTTYDAHAWNIVKVDGVWYHIDITYLDEGWSDNDYFLVPDNVIYGKGHHFWTVSGTKEICCFSYKYLI